MITRQQAALLAQLARTIRPEWDELVTINTITELTHPLAAIAAHVIAVANNPAARTPKAILILEWATSTAGSPRHYETCIKDGHSGWATNCPQCRSEQIANTPAN